MLIGFEIYFMSGVVNTCRRIPPKSLNADGEDDERMNLAEFDLLSTDVYARKFRELFTFCIISSASSG